MFRYTPPWQVLCHSLDLKNKGPSAGDRQVALSLQSFQSSSVSAGSTSPPADMGSTPRRWMLKPLSPLLKPSDLRSIPGPVPALDKHDSGSSVEIAQQSDEAQTELIWSQEVALLQDGNSSSDEWQPSSPSSNSSSHCGFYSFVDDPKSPEAEQNEAWMVSPQRQAQLALLKKEKGFKLQTYSGSRKPQSLFSESKGESQYILNPNNGIHLMDEGDEAQLRMEIIRSQAPKRNQTEPQKQVEDLDPILSSNKLIEGFSLSFNSVRSRPEPPCSAEPGTIDKEQIDFSAARQKFLKMEQDQLVAILSSVSSSRTQLNSPLQQDPDVYISRKVKVYGTTDVSDGMSLFEAAETDETNSQRTVSVSEPEDNLNRQEMLDDLDSGLKELSVEVAGSWTSDDGLFDNTRQDNRTSKYTALNETPIEREIRLAQEREEDLRRSRGLKNSNAPREMVKIQTRRSCLPLTPVRIQEKHVGFFVHDKIHSENQMKEQLQELEGILKQECQDPSLEPQDIREVADTKEDNNSEVKRSQSESELDEVFLSPCCPHRHTEDIWFHQTNQATSPFPTKDTEFQGSHFHQDQMALSPSSPASLIPTTLPEASPLSWRETLESTGLQSRGQGAPDFIEKEIKEALRREQELRESRESIKETGQPLFSPPPLVEQASKVAVSQFYPSANTEKTVSASLSSPHLGGRLPSISFITAKPWTSSSPSATSSLVRAQPVPLVARGLTETLLQDFEESQAKLKLEESSYAGIQLVDDINNEVVESTRVVRHKSQRALRWEAGLFADQENQ